MYANNKEAFYDQQIMAIRVADLFSQEMKDRINNKKRKNGEKASGLPTVQSIYEKEIVIENDPNNAAKNNNFNGKYRKSYQCEDSSDLANSNGYGYQEHKLYDEEPEEVEYVLVRARADRNYNWRYPKHQQKRQTNLPGTVHCKSEDDLPIANTTTEHTSSGNETNREESENSKRSRGIYRKWDKSRFNFVKSKENLDDDTVPDFITRLVCKQFSNYSFFKMVSCNDHVYDKIFLEKEMTDHQGSAWSDFLQSHVNFQTSDSI